MRFAQTLKTLDQFTFLYALVVSVGSSEVRVSND